MAPETVLMNTICFNKGFNFHQSICWLLTNSHYGIQVFISQGFIFGLINKINDNVSVEIYKILLQLSKGSIANLATAVKIF